MFFLGLLIYLLILPLAYWFVLPLTPVLRGFPFAIVVIIQYAFSTLLAVLLAYLINVYNPPANGRIRNLVRIIGVRWLCALTASVILMCIGVGVFWFHEYPGTLSMGFLLPALVVSVLNAIGVEIPLRRLEETPEPGKVVLPEVPLLPEMKEEIVRSFQWKHEGKDYSLRLVIRRSVYESFKGRSRVLDSSKWSEEYVLGGITGEIRELAYDLYKIGMPFGTYREVSFALSFVQQVIKYQMEEGEYPRYPIETLVDEKGDCEDFSILGAAILKCMGYEIALLVLPGHAALGVAGATGLPGSSVERGGLRYYFCEMTAEGWKIGQMPDQYEGMKIEVFRVPSLPAKVVRLEDTSVAA